MNCISNGESPTEKHAHGEKEPRHSIPFANESRLLANHLIFNKLGFFKGGDGRSVVGIRIGFNNEHLVLAQRPVGYYFKDLAVVVSSSEIGLDADLNLNSLVLGISLESYLAHVNSGIFFVNILRNTK